MAFQRLLNAYLEQTETSDRDGESGLRVRDDACDEDSSGKKLKNETEPEASRELAVTKTHSENTKEMESEGRNEDSKLSEIEEAFLKLAEHTRYFVIDIVGESYYAAIDIIKKHSIVGMCLEGQISRFGKLSFLNICIEDVVFMFDIEKLDYDGFPVELQGVLESPEIMKVMHDCKFSSDCLYHIYSLNLVNIFDTQVASLVDFYNERKCLPTANPSLTSCLFKYCDIPEDLILVHSEVHLEKVTQMEWFERPLPRECKKKAILNVLFLTVLRKSIMDSLMSPYFKAVNIYQTSVQSLGKINAEQMVEHTSVLPEKLLEILGARRTINNIVENMHPRFYFSRDTWCGKKT